MRQPQWDKFEAALLIEAYWKIKEDRSQRSAIVSALSTSLRKRADFEIDDTFRNENGISMRLGELDYLFTEGQTGLKNTSDLFREMVDLYRKDRTAFEEILSEAKSMTSTPLNTRELFCKWLQEKAPKVKPEIACLLLAIGEEFCLKIRILISFQIRIMHVSVYCLFNDLHLVIFQVRMPVLIQVFHQYLLVVLHDHIRSCLCFSIPCAFLNCHTMSRFLQIRYLLPT